MFGSREDELGAAKMQLKSVTEKLKELQQVCDEAGMLSAAVKPLPLRKNGERASGSAWGDSPRDWDEEILGPRFSDHDKGTIALKARGFSPENANTVILFELRRLRQSLDAAEHENVTIKKQVWTCNSSCLF